MRIRDIKYLNEGFDFEQVQFLDDEIDILGVILKLDIVYVDDIINNPEYYPYDVKEVKPDSSNILIKKQFIKINGRVDYILEITKDYFLNLYEVGDYPSTYDTLLMCSEIVDKIENKEINCIKGVNYIIAHNNSIAHANIKIKDLTLDKILTPTLLKYCNVIIKDTLTPKIYKIDTTTSYNYIDFKEFFKWFFSSYTKETYSNIRLLIGHNNVDRYSQPSFIYKTLFENKKITGIKNLNEGFDFSQAQIQDDNDNIILDYIIKEDIDKIIKSFPDIGEYYKPIIIYKNNSNILYEVQIKDIDDEFLYTYFEITKNREINYYECSRPDLPSFLICAGSIAKDIEKKKYNYINHINYIICSTDLRYPISILYNECLDFNDNIYDWLEEPSYKHCSIIIEEQLIPRKYLVCFDRMKPGEFKKFIKWFFSSYSKQNIKNINLTIENDISIPTEFIEKALYESHNSNNLMYLNEGFDFEQVQFLDDSVNIIESILNLLQNIFNELISILKYDYKVINEIEKEYCINYYPFSVTKIKDNEYELRITKDWYYSISFSNGILSITDPTIFAYNIDNNDNFLKYIINLISTIDKLNIIMIKLNICDLLLANTLDYNKVENIFNYVLEISLDKSSRGTFIFTQTNIYEIHNVSSTSKLNKFVKFITKIPVFSEYSRNKPDELIFNIYSDNGKNLVETKIIKL